MSILSAGQIIKEARQRAGLTQEALSENIQPQWDDVVIQNYKSYAHPQEGVVIYKISYKRQLRF